MSSTNWRIAVASVIGTSHLGTGLPCQDSSACEVVETETGPVLVAVVSDGAGSAAQSDIGSLLAAQTFSSLVKTFFAAGGHLKELSRDIACHWLSQTADVIALAAKEAGHSIRDYACTLLAAIVGEDAAAFIQIGDGAIVVSQGQDDGWSWIFWPQHGEFANTTNFIVSADATQAMDFCLTPGRIKEMAVFSDGIENLVLHQASRTVHAAFFDAMLPPVRRAASAGLNRELSDGLARYLASPTICEKTDDDKSLNSCDMP